MSARYSVAVTHAGAGWSAETFDLSPAGCQIVTPRAMQSGDVAQLVIHGPAVAPLLTVVGKVAWTASQGRLRAGIAYAERQAEGDPAAWFRRVVSEQRGGEGAIRRLPDRIPHDTKLFLRPPPRFIFDFGPDESALLRLVGDGMTVETLLRAAPFPEATAAKLVFMLLEQQFLTLSLGEAAPAWKWKAAFAELDAGPAARRASPPPVTVPPAAVTPRPPPPAAPIPVATTPIAPPPAAPIPVATTPIAPPPAATIPVAPLPAAPPPAPPPAPVRAATSPVSRPADAQECLDHAKAAVQMGDISAAIALLRKALQLSPRDPEIAALLGQLAFRDRTPGAR